MHTGITAGHLINIQQLNIDFTIAFTLNKSSARLVDLQEKILLASGNQVIITAMTLTREEVIHIAKLARLALTEAEIDRFQTQLSQILDHVRQLQEVDTTGIQPTTNMLQARTRLRGDEPRAGFSQQQTLQNTQAQDRAQFKVPPILEQHE